MITVKACSNPRCASIHLTFFVHFLFFFFKGETCVNTSSTLESSTSETGCFHFVCRIFFGHNLHIYTLAHAIYCYKQYVWITLKKATKNTVMTVFNKTHIHLITQKGLHVFKSGYTCCQLAEISHLNVYQLKWILHHKCTLKIK